MISHFILIIFMYLIVINYLPRLAQYLPVIYIHGPNVEVFGIENLPENSENFIRAILLGYGIGISLLLLKVSQKMRTFIDRKFFRSKYDYRTALKEFSSLSLLIPNLESLAKSVVDNLNHIMHLKQIAVVIWNGDKFKLKASYGFKSPEGLMFSRIHISEFLVKKSNFIEIDKLNDEKLLFFKKQGAAFIKLIKSKDSLLGFLIIGEKKSEAAYNKDDIELLRLISSQIAAAIENIRLYKEYSEKERLEHELHLAKEIQLSSLPKPEPQINGLKIYTQLSLANDVG